jgi:hypothetical protein
MARCLQCRQHREHQVEEDVRVGIERRGVPRQDDAVETGPRDQGAEKQDDERPGPAEPRDAIGEAIAEGLLLVEGSVDVPADLAPFGDAGDHPALALGQLVEAGVEQLLGQPAHPFVHAWHLPHDRAHNGKLQVGRQRRR